MKSLSLISTLDQKEKKLLLFYLEDQPGLGKLAKALLDHEYSDSKALFAAAYRNKPYDDKLLRNSLYTITKFLEKIIAQRFLENNPVVTNYILMNHCFQFNLVKEYNGYLLRSRQHPDATESQHLLYAYLSQKIHQEYLEEKKRQFIQEELIRKDQLLDAYYFKEKLWNLFEIAVYKNIYHFEYSPLLAGQVQDIDPANFSFSQNALQFLKLLLRMYEEFEDDRYFYQALELLEKTYASIPNKDLRSYYFAIINYAIRKFNTGKKIYHQELFRIYALQIKHGVLLNEKGFIEPYAYKNIITIALQNKEYAWTKKFMEEYAGFLPKEEKNNAYQYNLANYYYYTGNFKKCLLLLQTVQFTDVYYNLDARCIILKIYFEEKEWNLLHDHAFAFRAFVLRQKDISDHHKKGYLNLIKWSGKLSNALFDNQKRTFLKARIAPEKNIRELKWLTEQMDKNT